MADVKKKMRIRENKFFEKKRGNDFVCLRTGHLAANCQRPRPGCSRHPVSICESQKLSIPLRINKQQMETQRTVRTIHLIKALLMKPTKLLTCYSIQGTVSFYKQPEPMSRSLELINLEQIRELYSTVVVRGVISLRSCKEPFTFQLLAKIHCSLRHLEKYLQSYSNVISFR